MIICVCNSLNDKAIKKACADCPRNAGCEQIFEALGAKPVCGQCTCYIEDVMIPAAQSEMRL